MQHCTGCGRPAAAGDHERCLLRRAYEPPRFCEQCGRRMVVKVTPTSYLATCSVHGDVSPG
ncbi:MAG: biotin synthase auxiliary protein BsaP [Mycobacteriales bacterium]